LVKLTPSGRGYSAKTPKLALVVIIIFSLLCLYPILAVAFDEDFVAQPFEVLGQLENTAKEYFTGDDLGFWFNDFQALGFAFDDWSFGSSTQENGWSYPYESVLLLLRRQTGKLQPYIFIQPGLLVSEEGLHLEWNAPKFFLGLSYSF